MEFPSLEQQVARLQTATGALAGHAHAAGLEAEVPTCPTWTVRHLLAHTGMVHRWARANLLGQESHPPTWNAEGQQVGDPIAWLQTGASALVEALQSVPEDVEAMVFLKDAPSPRLFWARRQAHETTIHAVDAAAAALGRFATAQDVDWLDEQVALDGIDEILTGFVTRGRRYATLPTFTVAVTGHAPTWTMALGEDGRVVTTRGGAPAEAVVSGSPSALYLALWNRGTEGVDDPAGVLPIWREHHRVKFS